MQRLQESVLKGKNELSTFLALYRAIVVGVQHSDAGCLHTNGHASSADSDRDHDPLPHHHAHA